MDEQLLDYKKANWDAFKQTLIPIIPPNFENQKPADIDNAIDDLFEHINSASSECIPLRNHKRSSKTSTLPLQ